MVVQKIRWIYVKYVVSAPRVLRLNNADWILFAYAYEKGTNCCLK